MAVCDDHAVVISNVRPARPADVAFLAAIDAAVNASPWSPGQFQGACSGALEATESALVLEQDAGVCGFIIFSQVLDEACIHNLAVHPAQQGGGLGRALVSAALELMKQDGARCCLLEVRESNVAARGLYAQLQFRLDGVRKDYYPVHNAREDALLMSRPL